ncbi:DUF72 domain-containing protein [Angustibacter peucedani]
MAGTARVGISGWTYAPWRGDFYPKGLPHRRELEHAASKLRTIEVNGTFYALQQPASFASWRRQVPEGFVFSVKGPRFITHMKRLRDVRVPLANFYASGPLALGDALGPSLWQLPATFPFDGEVVDAFLSLLPRTTAAAAALAAEHDQRVAEAFLDAGVDRPLRHALEARHASFGEPAALGLLERHGVAAVVADTARTWPTIEAVTADFVYARLHGDVELYASGYSSSALDAWADKVRGWTETGLDAYVYFDNDAKGFAPHDAIGLAMRLGAGPGPDDR